MKKKNKKEIIILSLIFIAIIACIILLILIMNGTIRDKIYLSQESVMYVSESPSNNMLNAVGSVSSYYSIYKDGTVILQTLNMIVLKKLPS